MYHLRKNDNETYDMAPEEKQYACREAKKHMDFVMLQYERQIESIHVRMRNKSSKIPSAVIVVILLIVVEILVFSFRKFFVFNIAPALKGLLYFIYAYFGFLLFYNCILLIAYISDFYINKKAKLFSRMIAKKNVFTLLDELSDCMNKMSELKSITKDISTDMDKTTFENIMQIDYKKKYADDFILSNIKDNKLLVYIICILLEIALLYISIG